MKDDSSKETSSILKLECSSYIALTNKIICLSLQMMKEKYQTQAKDTWAEDWKGKLDHASV